MKILRLIASVALAAVAFAIIPSCQKSKSSEPAVIPSLTINSGSVEVSKDGGTANISFYANVDWTVSTTADWITLSSASGAGKKENQEITVTAPKNTGGARTATITFAIESKSANASVNQASGDGTQSLTIAEFLKTGTTDNKWYRVTAEIAAISSNTYGNLYVADDTGILYVYGLTKTKVEGNDQSFSSLGLKTGDKLTFVGKHVLYSGTHEASGSYYENHTAGKYNGTRSSSTKAGWMELPATKDDDGFDVLTHYLYKSEGRSFTSYFDPVNRVARWQAYYLCKGVIGSGTRSNGWGFDPLMEVENQANINKNSFQKGNGNAYIRGHMVPSADRLSSRENIEVFFDTNVMPQNENFNSGSWENLENKVRDWYKSCDTLYVVAGADFTGSTEYVLDNENKHVTVPVGCYKVVLKYSKDEGYSGAAFYFENKKESAGMAYKSAAMSIDDLEKKLDMDFFVNLPSAVGTDKASAIEAEDPTKVEFWWK